MVQLNDLKRLFQPKRFYDSKQKCHFEAKHAKFVLTQKTVTLNPLYLYLIFSPTETVI